MRVPSKRIQAKPMVAVRFWRQGESWAFEIFWGRRLERVVTKTDARAKREREKYMLVVSMNNLGQYAGKIEILTAPIGQPSSRMSIYKTHSNKIYQLNFIRENWLFIYLAKYK